MLKQQQQQHREKMSSNTYQQIALILLVLCIVSPIESRYEKERKQDKSIGVASPSSSLSSSSSRHAPSQEATTPPLNLCKRNPNLSFMCHCSPDDESIKAQKAECWIISENITRKDPHWLAFNSQTQLQHLKFAAITNGNLSFVPTDILQSLKYLRTINIEYGHIHELHGFAFGNLSNLVNISLASNQVKIIGPYTFANHQHLHEINLEKNEIYELDRLALVNLPLLNRLNLDHNRLEVIQDDTFEYLSKLTELLLGNNSISKLTREIFKGLGNLKILNMSSNKMMFIGDTVFAELWSLQELELDNNHIEKISERAFDGLNNLKKLNLENNNLKTLEKNLFTGVPALLHLDLKKNELETITYNNIMPLMDNFVNNTNSILAITDNDFICDCRMSWLFDLKNATKNDDLRASLDDIECVLKKPKDAAFPKANDIFHNNIGAGNGAGNAHGVVVNEDETEYYDDEPDKIKQHHLMKLQVADLPCPEEPSDPTELPLSRESIGIDMSWVKVYSSSSTGTLGTCTALLQLAVAATVVSSMQILRLC